MNSSLKFSIITVSLNNQSTIRRTINSVLNQKYVDVEYIVIDGLSTDDTMKIVESYKENISYYVSQEDTGIYDAINKGISAASGDIIGILNADDIYADNTVLFNVQNHFISESTEAVYGDLVYFDPINNDKVVRYWKSGLFSMHRMRKGWMMPHPTLFVRKKVYEDFGCYSTDLQISSDYEMMIRLFYKNGVSVSYLAYVLVHMQVGGVSNRSFLNRLRSNSEDLVAWEKNGISPPFLLRFMKPLRKIDQFFNKYYM